MSAWVDTDPELAALAEAWAGDIEAGDVVKTRGGNLRIVRAVHRHPKANGKGSGKATRARRVFCYFAILHCSWTGRPYTVYSVAEMVQIGYFPVSVKRRSLESDLDRKIACDFDAEKCELTCCAVRGMP